MSVIDIENLLEEVSPESPCGEDLEYEPTFLEFTRKIQGTPERQIGDILIPAELPDWDDSRADAIQLLSRSKDLRLAVQLTRILLNSNGLDGLRDGLRLIEEMLRQYWHCLYPQLDPEDDNDPTGRVNLLAGLCDHETVLHELWRTDIVDSRVFGRYTLRDVDIALGKSLPSTFENEPPAQIGEIDAAFLDCDLVQLESNAAATTAGLEHIRKIESLVIEKVGAYDALDLHALRLVLEEVLEIYSGRLADRGGPDVRMGDAVTVEPTPEPVHAINGELNSREDVLRALAGACEYLARNDPSHPATLVLHRAMKLLSMDFLDLVQDIAPEALSWIETIHGLDSRD